MVAVPNNEVTAEDLATWYTMTQQLTKLKNAEMLLRKKIFAGKFPNPKEGTNSSPLDNGWVLKGTHSVDRKLDEPVFLAMLPDFVQAGFNPQLLVRRKPELVKSEYNNLTAEQQQFFDQALIITPGSPALKIELPAKNRKAGENAGDNNS